MPENNIKTNVREKIVCLFVQAAHRPAEEKCETKMRNNRNE